MPLPWEPPSPPKPKPKVKVPVSHGFTNNAAQVAKNTTDYTADLGPGPGLPDYPPGYIPTGFNPQGNYNADDPASLNYTPPAPFAPPAATPAATPAFNYSWSLENDPIYKMIQDQIAKANAQAGATAGTSFGQEFGQYGEIPDFYSTAQQLGFDPNNPLYSILMNAANDPNTRTAAQNLTSQELSTVGGYNRQLRYGTGDVYDLMGQRNTLRSGATSTGLEQNQFADRARRAQGIQGLLQRLTAIANSYNQTQQQGVSSLQQAAQQAALRQMSLYGNVPQSVLDALNLGG